MSSFYLHQACENLFYAVRLVFTLENSKQHNLSKLIASVRKYSGEFEEVFPCRTPEEKRLFALLKAAYVEARYNPGFVVQREDIDALYPMAERLFALVKRLCTERVEAYREPEQAFSQNMAPQRSKE